MNNYETVFILTPVLSDAQAKEAVDKFIGVLTEAGATIVNHENWGLRKLAYPIDQKTTGYYTLVEFDAEPEAVKKLKYAKEYADKRRSRRASAPAEATATEVEQAPAAE